VAAEPNKNKPGGPNEERAKMMRVLLPAGGIAVIIILVAVIASLSGGGRKMSDGSDGSANDPGLKEIANGVKYRDLKEGEGEPCPAGAKVKVHYTGWLTDGTVFYSSKERGQPDEFELRGGPGGVILGWVTGIPTMKPGGIRKLVIPPDMGYGAMGKPPKIPGGNTLIYEFELLSFTMPKSVISGPGKPMSDGSNGGTEDPGLKDIGNGLKIRDLKEGSGEPCPKGAKVTIHYTGWNVMGDEFDSSKKTGGPATFELEGLIKGWQEGIPGMKPGGIRKLVVPAELGYGPNPRGQHIPANATLIFEVELVRVN
jgi:peptidylprolyl isomerase